MHVINTAVPGVPQGIQSFNITSSTISLSWSPPLVLERHGLSIFGYTVRCLTAHSSLGYSNLNTERPNTTFVDLHPFTAYNCCVAANSNNGIGRLACLQAVTRKSCHFSSTLNHYRSSIVYQLYNTFTQCPLVYPQDLRLLLLTQ